MAVLRTDLYFFCALDTVQVSPVGKCGDGQQGTEHHCPQRNQRLGVVDHSDHLPPVVCSLYLIYFKCDLLGGPG